MAHFVKYDSYYKIFNPNLFLIEFGLYLQITISL